jgi:hypothetical protein
MVLSMYLMGSCFLPLPSLLFLSTLELIKFDHQDGVHRRDPAARQEHHYTLWLLTTICSKSDH